jgi:ABC-2 type transport system permease protein
MSAFLGTRALVRLALRLDRIRLAVWVLVITAVVVSTASTFAELYPTEASRAQFGAAVYANPSLRALIGPAFDLSTIGGLTSWRVGTIAAVLVAVMNILTVVRHTRAEEEAGRLELVGSAVVGRYAPLTAALTVALAADAVLAVLVAAGLAGLGLPPAGSVALALSLAASGAMFAAVAAAAAQVTQGARAAGGIAYSVLALSYLLRAVGDSAAEGGPTWLTWLSPIGWVQQTRPYAAERWEVFGLTAAFAVLAVVVAYALVARRDHGAGLVQPRPGPAHASPALGTPLGLAWRLQRGALLGWAAGFAGLGGIYGAVADGVRDLLGDNPQLGAILSALGGEQALVDAYLAATLGVIGLFAAAFAVQATLRLRSEETSGRAEAVLATRVGRTRWALSHAAVALLGTAVVLVLAGLAMGLLHGLRTGDVGGQVARLTGAALVRVPAAWVLAGVALALFGLLPRFTIAAWGALVVFLLLGQLGPVLQLDQWALDLSPFTHVPNLPGAELAWAPVLWLLAATAALAALGLAAFRRRDVG